MSLALKLVVSGVQVLWLTGEAVFLVQLYSLFRLA
jgi:hypothetical protein